MAKTFTKTQRDKLTRDLAKNVRIALHEELVEIEHDYDGGWLRPLQETILEAISASIEPIILNAIISYDYVIEREENARMKKLEEENKSLKKENRKYAAIKKVISDAEKSTP